MADTIRLIAFLLVAVFLLALSNIGPLLLAIHVHPVVGCLAAIVAALIWVRLVPPTFGCLQGIVSVYGVYGVMQLLGTAILCLSMLFWRSRPVPTSDRSRPALTVGLRGVVHGGPISSPPNPRDQQRK